MPAEIVDKFEVPWFLNAPWLTEEYVRGNAWHPVPELLLEDGIHHHRKWGAIPARSRNEFRAGDIIIFDEWNHNFDEHDRYESDRFYTVTERDIQDYLDCGRDLLPSGVVVHPPQSQ